MENERFSAIWLHFPYFVIYQGYKSLISIRERLGKLTVRYLWHIFLFRYLYCINVIDFVGLFIMFSVSVRERVTITHGKSYCLNVNW